MQHFHDHMFTIMIVDMMKMMMDDGDPWNPWRFLPSQSCQHWSSAPPRSSSNPSAPSAAWTSSYLRIHCLHVQHLSATASCSYVQFKTWQLYLLTVDICRWRMMIWIKLSKATVGLMCAICRQQYPGKWKIQLQNTSKVLMSTWKLRGDWIVHVYMFCTPRAVLEVFSQWT